MDTEMPIGKRLESGIDEQTKMIVRKGAVRWIGLFFGFYGFFFFLAVRKEEKMQTVVTVVGPVSDTFVLMMEMWWSKVGLPFLTEGKE